MIRGLQLVCLLVQWCCGNVSAEWHETMVPAIERKKRHLVQTIGEQLFATILLRKLKVTGADTKNVTIGRGCADAWQAGNFSAKSGKIF